MTSTYTYDIRSELIGAVSDGDASYTYAYAYAYDPIGNRISANEAGVPWTYTANNLNQYTAMTEDQVQLTFAYDLDGSMTYRPVDAAIGWTQVWNGENRMVETWKGDDRLTFQYDYMGRRVEKKVYDGQTLTTHLKFVYDGFKLVEELDALNADAPFHRYAWQPDDVGLDVVLKVAEVPSTADLFYLHDANKNAMQMTDNNGLTIGVNVYSPYGLNIGNYMNPFGFSSEYYDVESGISYYNYRYLMINLGRWNKRDMIGILGGINLNAFAENAPVYKFDSKGNGVIAIGIGVITIGGLVGKAIEAYWCYLYCRFYINELTGAIVREMDKTCPNSDLIHRLENARQRLFEKQAACIIAGVPNTSITGPAQ